MKRSSLKVKEFGYAFSQTVPILLGYLFLGFAFGLMLQDAGYNFLWALFMSICIYAGSMQFVAVTLLTGGASLVYTAIMTIFINGRHIFYGLSFVERFKKMGRFYPYLIFTLTDETYSVLCDLKVPEGMDEKRLTFYISTMDHVYWITGSVLGALIGQMVTLNTTGIDFSMTALFIVIVVNQWLEHKNHFPALVGFLTALLMLVVLGPDRFLMPALMVLVILLILCKKYTGWEEKA